MLSKLAARARPSMHSRMLHTTRPLAKAGTWLPGEVGFETKLVHGEAVKPEPATGAILTPVFASSTFVQDSVEEYLQKGFSYSRTNNPTVSVLEAKIAELEHGVGSVVTGTGMAATATVMSTFLQQGDHVVITDCSYGGTNRICRVQFQKYGIDFSFVDFTDLNKIKEAIIPGRTKMIFSETPANPVLSLVDMDAVSAMAKECGAIHVCDSTFATPVIMRPLDHGADITIQSLTKFYCGHNIATGGAVICKSKEHLELCKLGQNMHGNIMAPQVAFSVLQTMKTMHLRVKRQSETAMKISAFLEKHPKVTKVVYPGTQHPQKELADKYHRDNLHGAMMWFELSGGSEAGIKLMNNIHRPWSLCENLGQTESIITACAVMTHANMLKEDRLKVGITDGFIRVSCGIEDADDLIKALELALEKC